MIIEIKYSVIKMDNYQGGSGKPFFNKLLLNYDDNKSIKDLYDFCVNHLEKLHKEKTEFCQCHNLIYIKIRSQYEY